MHIWLIKFIVFLSSFLLFQIELIIGKIFLSNFGGSYLVWGACVVFFQATLLAGYKYSQFVLQKLSIDRYRYFHLLLLLCPLLSFPGRALPLKYDIHSIPMVFDVFGQLIFVIGLSFFALSTMSIIWQVWLSKSYLPERSNPYVLFSVSNLGSFAALLSYPFFFELIFDLHMQQNIWRINYGILLILQLLALKFINVRKEREAIARQTLRIPPKQIMNWVLYSASGVMVFLSVTNIVTLEITPMPLLWVIPLALYLLSFVLVFKQNSYCPGWIKSHYSVLIGFGILFYFIMKARMLPVLLELIILFLVTFGVCLFAQFKLYLQKPANHQLLPYYYFMIALGGFVGGVIVTWVIPLLTTTLLEYFVGFLGIAIALDIEHKEKRLTESLILIICLIALLLLWPKIFPHYNFCNYSGTS